MSLAPALSVIAASLGSALLYAAALTVIVQVFELLPKRWIAIPAGLLAAAALCSGDTRTFGEFALQYGVTLVGLACAAPSAFTSREVIIWRMRWRSLRSLRCVMAPCSCWRSLMHRCSCKGGLSSECSQFCWSGLRCRP